MEQKILQVEGVTKNYGSHSILKKVTFAMTSGQIVGLVGANGAGKTTLMKAILGLIHCTGTIKVAGTPVCQQNHRALKRVGALIEQPSLTGREQLQMFASGPHRKQRVSRIIYQLHLENYIDQKSKGYSLGMKQKLGLALALVNQPQLVILDEPLPSNQLFQSLLDQQIKILDIHQIRGDLETSLLDLLQVQGK
ncbi:ATP-binding cassette domain-containing protein [Lactobacillus sp. DCY120]|uniref:ATP-binding cassette domain-containing protein n=1 Tax=Bombilactobacillus apium TaxID=2675299 RepID=A0A850RCH0_9LACO|nr:ATP-binding cassette domain-containing protein [Bombilactobacillus apium]NVY96996.1 ATP-binding cassette domain-containing protein [Bombilactobacillus apium]